MLCMAGKEESFFYFLNLAGVIEQISLVYFTFRPATPVQFNSVQFWKKNVAKRDRWNRFFEERNNL